MSDDASFQPRQVTAVHGEYYKCLVTGMTTGVECHHILGRGGKDDRKLMSSILNCAPLWDIVHKRGWINNLYFQQFLLDIVYRKVQDAVRLGQYEMTKNDIAFRSHAQHEFASALL